MKYLLFYSPHEVVRQAGWRSNIQITGTTWIIWNTGGTRQELWNNTGAILLIIKVRNNLQLARSFISWPARSGLRFSSLSTGDTFSWEILESILTHIRELNYILRQRRSLFHCEWIISCNKKCPRPLSADTQYCHRKDFLSNVFAFRLPPFPPLNLDTLINCWGNY